LKSCAGARRAKVDDQRDATRCQVLLIANATVGCEQQLEPCVFGGVQERAVAERVPAPQKVERTVGLVDDRLHNVLSESNRTVS
jgi:hypothetical protein